MFGFLQSNERKMRENAENWLRLADKVGHYRRDQLPEARVLELRRKSADLRLMLRQRADAGRLKLGIDALEDVLRPIGGAFYPKSSIVENVEFLLVAAIIVLGVRTFFLQPFKIPTNSMWPTYYGMTAENLPPGTPAPGLLGQAFRFIAFGAQRREAVAPTDGEISLKFFGSGYVAFTVRPAHKWLVIPTEVHEYTFYVDGVETTVQVPVDFGDFDRVVQETLLGGSDGLHFLEQASRRGAVSRSQIELREGSGDIRSVYLVKLGRTVRAGDPIVRFDLLTGDQLFVDRLSYHFVRPKVGDGFVFRTRHIAYIGADQYYVKRLVGLPGDTLEVRPPVLYRNGRPIAGAAAFNLNANRVGLYRGYFNGVAGGESNLGLLAAPGETVTVAPHSFFAMGDNSGNSKDGRYWGFVPEKDVVGRPLFIYYPFTRRWGPAR